MMSVRHRKILYNIVSGTFTAPGDTSEDVRRAIFGRAASLSGWPRDAGDPPEALTPLVEKIAKHAYKVTDRDITELCAAGWSEDALFEVIIAAAVGAGTARLEVGLAALEAANREEGNAPVEG